jgi:3-oxoadipate enol-lactonase
MRAMEVVTGDTAHLQVWEQGRGDPLVLIPGLASGAHAFAELAPMLAADFRVVTFDPRGIGESGVGDDAYTIGRLAQDLTEILDLLEAKPAAIFGLSMGGIVAMELALSHPSYVSRLILGATYCSTKLPVPPADGTRDLLLGRGAKTPAEAYRLACQVLYSSPFVSSHPDFIASEITHRGRHPISGKTFTDQERARSRYEACSRLGTLDLPSLVMHGAVDVLVPEPNARDLSQRISGCEYHVIEGAGHLFFHEEPEPTCDWIRLFLRSA